jgi:transcriptional regulator with XRE-family HTH domain
LPRRAAADPTARAFGQAIRRIRQQRGETLEAVARRVPKLDPKYLGEIERGWHTPSISTAKRIADALDTPLPQLVRDL